MHGHMSVKFHRRYVLTGNALEALSFWFWILLRTVDEQTVCQPLPHTNSMSALTAYKQYVSPYRIQTVCKPLPHTNSMSALTAYTQYTLSDHASSVPTWTLEFDQFKGQYERSPKCKFPAFIFLVIISLCLEWTFTIHTRLKIVF